MDLSAALFAQDEKESKEEDKKEDDDKSSNKGDCKGRRQPVDIDNGAARMRLVQTVSFPLQRI